MANKQNDCPYCNARPALGLPPSGVEPQCLMCWDTSELLTDDDREARVAALPYDAPVRVAA